MKKILFLLMAIAITSLAASAATKYEINIAGTEVTSDNASYIGPSSSNDIESGYAVYNASTNTLTCHSLKIYRTGNGSYGIHNRQRNDLTIVFKGYCSVATADHAMNLARSTTIFADAGSTLDVYTGGSSHALNLGSYSYFIAGSGDIFLNGKNAIHGNGSGSTTLYFQGAKVSTESNLSGNKNHALESFKAVFNEGADLKIISNGSYTSVNNVSMYFYGKETVLSPYGAYYSNSAIYSSSGNQITSQDIYISDQYVAKLSSDYFPDANFRSFLLSLYPKGYLTQTDINNRTSLNVAGQDIYNLTGVSYFSKLTSLDCRVNNLYSLPTLPSTLTDLRCQNNALTSLQSLPSGLKYLYCNDNLITSLNLPQNLEVLVCSNNRMTSLLMNNYNALTNVDCSNNPNLTTIKINNNSSLQYLTFNNCPSLTTLECYQNIIYNLNFSGCNAIQTINCSGNRLTSLSLQGYNTLTTLDCSNNQITTLGTLPSSLQKLYCSSNKFSGTFNLTGRSNLKTLDISSNPSITTLNCYSNALTSLNVKYCSAMTTLQCYSNQIPSLNLTGCSALVFLSCQNNQITSFTSLPTTLQTIYCNDNKLSGGTFDVSGRSALKILDIKNNPNFSGLKCNNCSLTSLSVSGCTGLTTLDCGYNQLSSLDVSSLSNLTVLNCRSNKLTSLNVSNKTKLTQLEAQYNQLTSINVQGCSSLNYLMLESNKLTSLSVQGCNALRTINCCLNKISASGANTLINSLCTIPSGSQGALRYIYPGYSSGSYVENNVNLTGAQVQTARNKRWYPKQFGSNGWVDISAAIPGDVNGDGHVSSADVTALYDHLLNNDSSNLVNGDVDGDGHITSGDITAVYSIMLGN